MNRKQTPSQTVGPFFAYGLTPEQYRYDFAQIADHEMRPEQIEDGEAIRIQGRVFDGDGKPVEDAMLELWQPNPHGRFNHPEDSRSERPLTPGFTGFGRIGTGTDPHCRYYFDTLKPGAMDDKSAPFATLTVFMRGILLHAYTRIYFSDESAANASDPVLQSVPEARRNTLIAQRQDGPTGVVYHFDVHMQGPKETVFFDL